MWGWGWGGNSSSSAESAAADGEHHVVEEDPDGHEHADLAAPEVDANGAHYTDEAKSLEVGRQGVLPSLVHHPWGAWTEDDLTGLQLRGAGYLQDHVKIACGPPLFRLAHIDIFHTLKEEDKILHIAQRDNQWLKVMTSKRKKALEKCRSCDGLCHGWSSHPLNPTFVINIVFPVKNIHMYLVQYYERRVPPADVLRQIMEAKGSTAGGSKHRRQEAKGAEQDEQEAEEAEEEEEEEEGAEDSEGDGPFCCRLLRDVDLERVEAFDRLLQQFLDGDDDFRDATLKIIPRVSEGSWVVKKGVGRVPAILGKKVSQSYHRSSEASGLNYVEVDADLATSRIAGQIVGLIKSYCKTIVVDMSFLLQGDSEDTLPESLIGGIRIHKADMDKVQHFDVNAKDTKYPAF